MAYLALHIMVIVSAFSSDTELFLALQLTRVKFQRPHKQRLQKLSNDYFMC